MPALSGELLQRPLGADRRAVGRRVEQRHCQMEAGLDWGCGREKANAREREACWNKNRGQKWKGCHPPHPSPIVYEREITRVNYHRRIYGAFYHFIEDFGDGNRFSFAVEKCDVQKVQ